MIDLRSSMASASRFVVHGMFGDTVVTGVRIGEWAAHRQINSPHFYGLTLVPIGLSLPFAWASFRSLGPALDAIREINRMRNDWHRVGQEDFTKALEARLISICSRNRATSGPIQWSIAVGVGLMDVVRGSSSQTEGDFQNVPGRKT